MRRRRARRSGSKEQGAKMVRSELVQKIQEANPDLRHSEVQRIVSAIFEEIADAMAVGDRIEIRGFGAFSAKLRHPRRARNPRTGDAVDVPAKYVPFFKTGKLLRERLNGRADG